MARQVAPLGASFEIVIPMTDNLTITDGATNLVYGSSGLSGGKTLTLCAISSMVGSQNPEMIVMNKSSSGGTITIAANSADSIIGATTVAVATGRIAQHDGIHTLISRFTGQLYVDDAPQQIIFGFAAGSGWIIPGQFAPSTTWDQLDVYNQGQVQFPFGIPTTLTSSAIVALIDSIPKGTSG